MLLGLRLAPSGSIIGSKMNPHVSAKRKILPLLETEPQALKSVRGAFRLNLASASHLDEMMTT